MKQSISPHTASRAADRFDLISGNQYRGVRSRRMQPGPETELVQQFLVDWPLTAPKCCRTTIFQEPKLVSGYPDLVAVFWHEPTTLRWDARRLQLSGDYLRLLHLLATLGPQPEHALEQLLGFPRVNRTLEQLKTLGLVSLHKNKWRVVTLRKAFAARSIIAFEAKVSDWHSTID